MDFSKFKLQELCVEGVPGAIFSMTFYEKTPPRTLCLVHQFDSNINPYPGLQTTNLSEEEVPDFIKNNLEEAFKIAVRRRDDNTYILNIACQDGNSLYFGFGAHGFFYICDRPDYIQRQLDVYMPIIQKFMFDMWTKQFDDSGLLWLDVDKINDYYHF